MTDNDNNFSNENNESETENLFSEENDLNESKSEADIQACPEDEVISAEPPKSIKQTKYQNIYASFFETIKIVFGAFIIAGLINCFVVQAVQINQTSMYPTFNDKDKVILLKSAYWLSTPESGDIVVFKKDSSSERLIKRVIGLPGDTIEIKDGVLYRNGVVLDEPYIAAPTRSDYSIVVPEGKYFCLGDNRNMSKDSREASIGCVSLEEIKGKIILSISPFSLVESYNHSYADKE